MGKADGLPPGEAICDHCNEQHKINLGGIGAFYYPKDCEQGQIVWLCRVGCQAAWEREHMGPVTCAQCNETEPVPDKIWAYGFNVDGKRITRWLHRERCRTKWERRLREWQASKQPLLT